MKKLMSTSLLVLSAVALQAAAPSLAGAADPDAPVTAAAAASDSGAPAAKPAGKAARASKAGKGKAGKAGKGVAKGKAGDQPAGVPQAVLDEMNDLINKGVQLASPELQTGDRFQPYGVLKMDDGTMNVVKLQLQNPPPDIKVLRAIYIKMYTEVRSNPHVVAGVTFSTAAAGATQAAPEKGGVETKLVVTGIRADVDHRQGAPMLVFIPYTKENGKLIFGTQIYRPGVDPLFEHSQAPTAPTAPTVENPAPATPTAAPTAESAKPEPAAAAPAQP